MASLPVEQTGESVAESHKTLPTPFLTKTYQLVEDPSVDELVSWNEDGSTFIVWKPAEFARDLLPKYFKHNNFSSFVRQLNTYGFRKVMQDKWEFSHECFKRDNKRLLRDIKRRKISPSVTAAATTVTVAALPVPAAQVLSPTNSGDEQVLSSNSSPMNTPLTAVHRTTTCTTTPELLEENDRLRKENSALVQELGEMRGLCGNVVSMMSNYAAGNTVPGNRPEVKPLDLLPATQFDTEDAVGSGTGSEGYGEEMVDGEDDTCPMLFGVSIGMKRVRGVEEDETEKSREDQVKDRGCDLKYEPLDVRENYRDRSFGNR